MSEDAGAEGFVSWESSSQDPTDPPHAPKAIPAYTEGQTLGGRFRIRDELGRGAMGIVYRALDQTTDREVALKVMRSGVRSPTRARLRREGELTASLDHPGIVRIHAAGEADGVAYLVYELVEDARTLDRVIDAAPRPERLRLLRDVARAVGHAHSHGVLHRDLKPANVIVDRQGRVRVADFGLAWAEGVDPLTLSGGMVGTPRFMPPEQFAGRPDDRGPAMDVWALGVMLYVALTGAQPFPSENLQALTTAILTTKPKPPRALDPSISADLQAVCLKALERLPKDRYPDCQVMATDLDLALAGKRVSASDGRAAGLRPRLARGATAIALCLLAIVGGASLWTARTERALRHELTEFKKGGPRDSLEALLAEKAPDSPLAAEAHLALAASDASENASGDSDGTAGWESRLQHARRAAALGKGDGLARILEARALEGLGRHSEAAKAFAQAFAQGGTKKLLRLRAVAHLEAGELAKAKQVALAYVAQRPTVHEGWDLLLRIQLRQRDAPGARATLEQCVGLLVQQRVHLLRAEITALEGGDPRPALREAIKRWPQAPEPRMALALERLGARGDAVGARAILKPVANSGEPQALTFTLDALLADPPDLARLRGDSARRRDAAGAWLLREGLREAAYCRDAVDPRVCTPGGALPAAEREQRARRRLGEALTLLRERSARASRAHAALARLTPQGDPERAQHLERALASATPDPVALRLRADEHLRRGEPKKTLADLDLAHTEDEDGLVLRGRALIALGRNTEAARVLAPAADLALACELRAQALAASGDDAAAATQSERAGLLRGAKREEARAIFRAARAENLDLKTLSEACAEALALDPLLHEASYFHSRGVSPRGDAAGFSEAVTALSRHPELLTDMFRSMFSLSAASGLGSWGGRRLRKLAASMKPDTTPMDRLTRATLLLFSVEYDGDRDALEPALALLDDVLDERPADSTAWLMRGVLHLRADRLDRAARDLEIAREGLGDQGALLFYEALLLAGRRVSTNAVRAKLLEAKTAGFRVWGEDGWTVALYPRLVPFAGRAGLEFLDR